GAGDGADRDGRLPEATLGQPEAIEGGSDHGEGVAGERERGRERGVEGGGDARAVAGEEQPVGDEGAQGGPEGGEGRGVHGQGGDDVERVEGRLDGEELGQLGGATRSAGGPVAGAGGTRGMTAGRAEAVSDLVSAAARDVAVGDAQGREELGDG